MARIETAGQPTGAPDNHGAGLRGRGAISFCAWLFAFVGPFLYEYRFCDYRPHTDTEPQLTRYTTRNSRYRYSDVRIVGTMPRDGASHARLCGTGQSGSRIATRGLRRQPVSLPRPCSRQCASISVAPSSSTARSAMCATARSCGIKSVSARKVDVPDDEKSRLVACDVYRHA